MSDDEVEKLVQSSEILVTDEMLDVGLNHWSNEWDWNDHRKSVLSFYRAMAALAPKPDLVTFVQMMTARIEEEKALGLKAVNTLLPRIAALEADNAALSEELGKAQAQNARLADDLGRAHLAIGSLAFGDPTPSDLPDPPKRPDGTLAPQAKPIVLPRPNGDPRRIGG